MPIKAAIYARSGCNPAELSDRLELLQNAAAGRGWAVAATRTDRAVAGSRARLTGLAALFVAIESGEVDALLVACVADLGTSLEALVDNLTRLHQAGTKLVAMDQQGDAATSGELTHAASVLRQARSSYRSEAIRAGQAKARALGARFGRPPIPPAKVERVRIALLNGGGIRHTARKVGVSAAKVSQIRSELAAAS